MVFVSDARKTLIWVQLVSVQAGRSHEGFTNTVLGRELCHGKLRHGVSLNSPGAIKVATEQPHRD